MLSEQYLILLLIVMIGMNILVNYLYKSTIVFPVMFILFEIIYAVEVMSINETFVLFLLVFGVVYNMIITYNRWEDR